MNIAALIAVLASVLVVAHIAYWRAISNRRFDVVDVAWAVMFMAAALTSFFVNPRSSVVQLVMTVLVLLWGFRLSSHISARRRQTTKDDPRYEALRKKWGTSANAQAYGRIFLLQAFLAMIISLPVVYTNLHFDVTVSYQYVFIGVGLWLVGFVFESVGDWQLKLFLANKKNKGEIMTKGLWRYTRHPNYFGEVVQWWGVYVIALSVSGAELTIVGPLLITVLVLFVSGVPLTEKRFEGRMGWAEYKRRTSIFVPWWPRGLK